MYDVTIIGGGIVGLATAMQLKKSRPKLKIAVLEKEKTLASHQTGNNSGVIHSGLYYKPGSLKATNCLNGYKKLIDFCDRENIPCDLCGKIVVATCPNEHPYLEKLYQRGLENGLTKNKKITAEEISQLEPNITGLAGIWVPYAGIVDFKVVANRYADVFTEQFGGEIFKEHCVTAINRKNSHSEVIAGGAAFETKLIINTAGLYCDRVAQIGGVNPDMRIIPFRGEYYKLAENKREMIKNLVYPVPDPAFPFLGVHYTRRITGEMEAGPNAVLAYRREGYKKSDISAGELCGTLFWPGFMKVMRKHWRMGLGELHRSYSKSAFTRSLQKLSPTVQKSDLTRGGSGVRAQACTRDGRLVDDFYIVQDNLMINVLNAPSPAATASLAIGETIAGMVIF